MVIRLGRVPQFWPLCCIQKWLLVSVARRKGMASNPSSETSLNCSEVVNKLSLLSIECQGVTLFGKRMDVNFSKHAQINPSPDTSDFSSSPLNRFNRNAAKNYRYCCAPTKMIHVSSLPANITKEDIVAHLSPHGNIINAKIFESNGKKQALVLFENEDQATEALVCKHATQLQNSNIRLAFSKLASV